MITLVPYKKYYKLFSCNRYSFCQNRGCSCPLVSPVSTALLKCATRQMVVSSAVFEIDFIAGNLFPERPKLDAGSSKKTIFCQFFLQKCTTPFLTASSSDISQSFSSIVLCRHGLFFVSFHVISLFFTGSPLLRRFL